MRCAGSRLCLLLASSALSSPLLAQQAEPAPAISTPASRAIRYDAAFFAQYAPRNALDIARQVPGFALDLGNNDIRGFAAAAGNVVINSARPSSKSETLATILMRIPAQRVVRVEVGPGDLYGAEYVTRSQVLNVILSEEGGIDGNFTGSVRRYYTGKIAPNGSVSALIRRGASSINLSAGAGNVVAREEGTDTLTDALTGDLIEFRRRVNRIHNFDPYVSGSWALERGSSNALRLNARWSPRSFYFTQTIHVVPTGEPVRDDDLLQDYETPEFEIGGDITRPLGGGAIKLVGLATRRKRDNLDRYRFRANDETLGGFEQLQDSQLNETVFRLNWTRANLGGFSFEAGIEGALNTLDNQLTLFNILPGDERERIDLPLDDATVKERRAEAYARLGRQISKSIRLDGAVNYEYSNLTVGGDTQAERTLRFWKPSLTLDWKGGNGWHGQASIRRTVAQLDFFDFISSADLNAGRVNGGNANLVPQQTWEFRGTIEKPILGDGLAKLDVGYDLINDLQDRILIFDDTGNGFDAPGNIGTGRRSFASLTLDAPLTRLGIKGARLKLNGQLQRTRVTDPIDREKREFSGFFSKWQWSVDYRHDIGGISYGFFVVDQSRSTFFRTDELDTFRSAGPYGTAFVEYRPSKRTTVTFDVESIFDTGFYRQRTRFFPNRTNPPPVTNEFRERNRHVSIGLTLKQSFGSGVKGSGVAPAS